MQALRSTIRRLPGEPYAGRVLRVPSPRPLPWFARGSVILELPRARIRRAKIVLGEIDLSSVDHHAHEVQSLLALLHARLDLDAQLAGELDEERPAAGPFAIV